MGIAEELFFHGFSDFIVCRDEIKAETAESAIESKSVSNLTTDGPTYFASSML